MAAHPAHGGAATTVLTAGGGVRVVVTDSPRLATPYVLQEQGDWFEAEIRFVRRLLQPGEHAIDIGANHGLYALAMAQAVGPAGRIWAFEPASGVGALLAASLRENGYGHVQLLREALSDHEGSATMAVGENSELNTLDLPSVAGHGMGRETVALSTLDAGMRQHDWADVAFVKMDAEGEEARILDGGRRFLAACAPLVMFELRHGEALHLELLERFRALGFGLYRLVPGPCLLAPVTDAAELDPYVLNVFACKPARAQALAERGLLVMPAQAGQAPPPPDVQAWWRWCDGQPLGRHFGALWRGRGIDGPMPAALALHVQSNDPQLPAPLRLAALQASLQRLQALVPDGAAVSLASASLARVACAAGARQLGLQHTHRLLRALRAGQVPTPADPFLPPAERFDAVPPGASPAGWLLAATVEAYHRTVAHSAFYRAPGEALDELQAIADLGFADDDIRRRLDLARRRAHLLTLQPAG